jgi:hypothetical protein
MKSLKMFLKLHLVNDLRLLQLEKKCFSVAAVSPHVGFVTLFLVDSPDWLMKVYLLSTGYNWFPCIVQDLCYIRRYFRSTGGEKCFEMVEVNHSSF